MILEKFKKLLLPNQYSVNSLIKSTVINRFDSFNQQLTCARLAYLSKFKYSRTLTQGQQITLNNLLVHNSETTYNEVPHYIYHTIDQDSRLQVIPDENIFNLKKWKYGDFVNINTEKAVEAKSWSFLSKENLDDVKIQYELNKRNNKFIYSIFYEKIGNINENIATEYLANSLEIEKNQIVIKSFDNLFDYFTDDNIEKAINYYNISWSEYQIENNERLLRYLDELLDSNELSLKQIKEVLYYKKLLISKNINNEGKIKKNKRYPYKNNQLLLEDKNQVTPNESELTPELIMSDQQVIDFNEEENKNK